MTIFLRAVANRGGKEKEACRHGTPTGSKDRDYGPSIARQRGDVKMTYCPVKARRERVLWTDTYLQVGDAEANRREAAALRQKIEQGNKMNTRRSGGWNEVDFARTPQRQNEGDVIRKDGEHLLHCDKSCLEDWMHTNWSVEELLDAVGVGEAFAYEDL